MAADVVPALTGYRRRCTGDAAGPAVLPAWRAADDTERLDGANGLLLSPHVDHLFDEGYIMFSPSQSLVIVPEVREKLLDAWGIDAITSVGESSREQSAYLDYHRANVFKSALLECSKSATDFATSANACPPTDDAGNISQ